MRPIGRLEKLDVRELWPNEADDFSPWLKDNIGVLSEAIGIDIDVAELEGKVGNFYVDLVGTDLSTGRTVVIENQLESTDHDHLGKLLTYAAGRNASYAIWIASDFRREHLQVLEWLNATSNGEQGVFWDPTQGLQDR